MTSSEPSCYKIASEKCFIPVLQLEFVGTHLANVKTELLSRELLPSTFSDLLYKIITSFITLQGKKKEKLKNYEHSCLAVTYVTVNKICFYYTE